MKCYKALLMIAGLILAAAVWGQELPTYTCWKTSLVPLVDGDAADAAWSIAESTELFDVEDADRKQQHSRPTQVKMLWDDDNLTSSSLWSILMFGRPFRIATISSIKRRWWKFLSTPTVTGLTTLK